MKKKWFINLKTAEVKKCYTWWGAYLYFKRDSRKFNYELAYEDVEEWENK